MPTRRSPSPPTTPAEVPPAQNPPAVQLPKTGSNGTGMLAGLGLLLLAGGAVLLIAVRRPRSA